MAVSSKLIRWHGMGRQGTTEASDLGWKPGEWPDKMEVRSTRTSHTEHFTKRFPKYFNGEFAGFYYSSPRGLTVAVLND